MSRLVFDRSKTASKKDSCGSCRDVADHFIFCIDINGQFIAKITFTVLFRPGCLGVFLASFVCCPVIRGFTLTDLFILFLLIVLLRNWNQRGINDLTTSRNESLCRKLMLRLSNNALAPSRPIRFSKHQIVSREWRASTFGRNNTWRDTVYGVSQCREINILIKNK